ncbi:MAG: acetyl-CoA C-acetyltransferase [Calditrichia bacterium]|nr:acetyl-CoA C-acetyltransferase [Calditrichia bacterium]
MKSLREVVIVGAVRTPIGSFMGSLSSLPATKLGSIVIDEALNRAGIEKSVVDEVIMGNVLVAGEGQAPARQAALGANLPESIECLTINKVCGSGLKSVMLASQSIMVGDADVVVAGGMESMSNVPYYLFKARNGFRMGHQKLVDGMIFDGLWDVYNDFHMGNAAELCARECNISRHDQDEFSIMSYQRALDAQKAEKFKDEIVAVSIPQRKGDPLIIDTDEEPTKVSFDKIPTLKPVFDKEGTVTAANASSINDGAAAVVLIAEEKAKELGLKPMAKIGAQASTAKKPEWFTTAPADAVQKCLKKADLNTSDIDLYEINEAFAVVALAVNEILDLNVNNVNVNGGAVALGHPIGASGTRILVTLLYEMKKRAANRGLAGLCIGGGEASALIVEM